MFTQLYEEKFIRFPGGKTKALTFSYDDGVQADVRLLKLFEGYGLKGTFNLNSKRFDCPEWHGHLNEQQTFETFCGGSQEIALHGARHVFLEKIPLCEAVKEVADNREYLEGKFKKIVRGMAYPYNSYNADIKRAIKDLGVAYARTTNPTYGFRLPADFLEWNPTCHHSDKRLKELVKEFLNGSPAAEKKSRDGWLMYIWGHSYEFDDDGEWGVIEELAKECSGKEDIWYATNIEIYEYVTAFRGLVFSLDGERVYNPSSCDIWLELRGKIYKIPSGGTVCFEK